MSQQTSKAASRTTFVSRGGGSRRNNSTANGEPDQVGLVGKSKFFHQVGAMAFNGSGANEKFFANFAIGKALGG